MRLRYARSSTEIKGNASKLLQHEIKFYFTIGFSYKTYQNVLCTRNIT